MKPAAKANRGKVIYVFLDSAKEENKQILDFFGLKEEDLPEYLIYEVSTVQILLNNPKFT